MIRYKHTQIGHLMLLVLLPVVVLYTVVLTITPFNVFTLVMMILIVFILLSFVSLTVTIDNVYLRIRFGYGIFRKKFPLKEIHSTKIVKNRWYYGWGIRYWHSMWIYNVSGFDAVEIHMKHGKVYRIGTDNPERLLLAINKEVANA